MENFPLIWRYYSRKDIQDAILEAAKDREVVGVYSNGNFGKRPNIIAYPEDILQMVKQGVVSFHGSVERWSNPMSLEPGMLKQELDNLRIGWDLIIDPDCPDFEIAKLTTRIIADALKDHGMKDLSIKLTGGKSFHVGIPFEAFPKTINSQPIETLYPAVPRKVLEYLKDYVRETLKEEIMALDNPLNIAKRVEKSITDITDKDGLDPFRVVEIDSMMIVSRHMFRLPFSLHEKSLLVSLPIDISKLNDLKKGYASPLKMKVKAKFLTEKPKMIEAKGLVVEALDWAEEHKIVEERVPYTGAKRMIREVGKKDFPGCVLKILKGLPDGRKRSLFILINFLQNMGWSWDKINTAVEKWNERNTPPLPTNYVRTQLRWHQRQQRNLLPPNCDNKNFYVGVGVCLPDIICKGKTNEITIKNPVNYPFRKMKQK